MKVFLNQVYNIKSDSSIRIVLSDSLDLELNFGHIKSRRRQVSTNYWPSEQLVVKGSHLKLVGGHYKDLGQEPWQIQHAERGCKFMREETQKHYMLITRFICVTGTKADTSQAFVDGKVNGLWRLRDAEGYSDTPFKNGLKEGKEISYNIKRKYCTETNYVAGKKNGKEITTFKKGNTIEKVYVDGKETDGPYYYKKRRKVKT